jgi:hypothetical protein
MTYAKKTDRSQDAIVAALRDVGATWVPTSGDPRIGFDGIVVFRGQVFIVELKNADDVPSRRELTKQEQKRKWEVERCGGVYHIWMSADEALRGIGAI